MKFILDCHCKLHLIIHWDRLRKTILHARWRALAPASKKAWREKAQAPVIRARHGLHQTFLSVPLDAPAEEAPLKIKIMRLIVLHPCLHRWGGGKMHLFDEPVTVFMLLHRWGGKLGQVAVVVAPPTLLRTPTKNRSAQKSLAAFGKAVLDVACDLTEHMPRMDSSSPGSIIKRFVSEAAEKAEFKVQSYSPSKGLFIQSRRQLAILPSPGTPAKRPRRALSHEHDAEFWAPFQDHLDPSLSASLSES